MENGVSGPTLCSTLCLMHLRLTHCLTSPSFSPCRKSNCHFWFSCVMAFEYYYIFLQGRRLFLVQLLSESFRTDIPQKPPGFDATVFVSAFLPIKSLAQWFYQVKLNFYLEILFLLNKYNFLTKKKGKSNDM